MTKKIFVFFISALFLSVNIVIACTAFLFNESSPMMAKSYDWHFGHGYILVNKRHVYKKSLIAGSNEKALKWTSRLGSITFNQFGREFPHGGINEAGLAIELLWLDETSYPSVPQKPVLNELQWIQYQLDTSWSVDDLIAHAKEVEIDGMYARIHYLACDKQSKCATIEYIDGKLTIHENIPYKLITNNSYDSSLSYLKNFSGFGGDEAVPEDSSSLSRFVRAASMIKDCDSKCSMEQGLKILNGVWQNDYTRWHIVYELEPMRVSLQTDTNELISYINGQQLNYDCMAPVEYVDIEKREAGNIESQFKSLSYFKNRELIQKSFDRLSNPPKQKDLIVSIMSSYPSTTLCLGN